MHNNIMAAGSRDRPPMLALGRYAQWQSRFLRYIDTKPNGDALRKCILQGPYTPTTVIIPVVPATDSAPAVPERITIEIILNMFPENKAHYESEKEAIYLLLTGIRDEIYSTIDKNGNLLALVAATQPHPDPCYQAPKSHKSYAPTSKASNQTRSHATTKQPQSTSKSSINLPTTTSTLLQTPKTRMWILLQAEKGIPLQAEQSDWLADTDEEIDEQELEAHYNFMAKIQEVPTADSGTDTELLEHVQYDTEYNMFANERQHSEQPESISNTCVVEKVDKCDDERVVLANLIVNLKLDVDENKKIQKKLKKANTSLAHELKECKSILAETSRTLEESNNYLKEPNSLQVKVKIIQLKIVNIEQWFRACVETLNKKNSINLAFLSSENTGGTNEVSTVSGDFGVSTAVPQLEMRFFSRWDGDDLEEVDLRMAGGYVGYLEGIYGRRNVMVTQWQEQSKPQH
ncbi:hypothetical protein Tco_0184727 [Tanacetum coccineum]